MAYTLQQLLQKAEPKLKELHPVLADKARQLIEKAYKEGIWLIITQGFRSIEEQNALYAQGRSKPGKIVTDAKGGYSYHNYGLAFDFAILNKDGSVDWTVDEQWKRVGAIGKSLGLEWGGDWKALPDYPHFQYTFGLTINDLLAGKRPPKNAKPTAPTKQAPKSATKPTAQTYVVQKGDTLTEIAKKFKTTVKALQELNGIKNPNMIRVGQKLRVK